MGKIFSFSRFPRTLVLSIVAADLADKEKEGNSLFLTTHFVVRRCTTKGNCYVVQSVSVVDEVSVATKGAPRHYLARAPPRASWSSHWFFLSVEKKDLLKRLPETLHSLVCPGFVSKDEVTAEAARVGGGVRVREGRRGLDLESSLFLSLLWVLLSLAGGEEFGGGGREERMKEERDLLLRIREREREEKEAFSLSLSHTHTHTHTHAHTHTHIHHPQP